MNSQFGIYVHWPYCAAKCPYCDFNSHVRREIDHSSWRTFYMRELDYYASLTTGREVTSIFFGGGTPSLMEPETAGSVIDHIHKRWSVANDVEITLEANPTSVEIQKFSDFKKEGVNRVSVGIQSLRDDDLEFLGREHSAAEALEAFAVTRDLFDRYSFDLIYARPDQTAEQWTDELSEALEYAGSHLSLYQLTIERGTPFYLKHKRGEFSVPEQDNAGALFEVTQTVTREAGLPAYEVSNHAAPGEESRHNLLYWRYGDYIGIGPGAHGRLTLEGQKYATRGHRAPDIWMARVGQHGHGGYDFENIDPVQYFIEAMLMGLRLYEGVDLADLARRAGVRWQDYVHADRVDELAGKGFLSHENGRIQPLEFGVQRLNGMLDYLLKDTAAKE